MIFTVYVKPGSRENHFEKIDSTTIKISVREKAIKGQANAAVIKLLSKEFNAPKSLITIVRGHNTKIKHISIET